MELSERIEVRVTTRYLTEQSDPEDERFVFAYEINIQNHSHENVTLKGRHWYVTNGNGEIQEVEGEGVVGEQPTIPPGGEFTYSSGSVLSTRVGSMRGYYLMETDAKQRFHATIPVFTLASPHSLN